MKSTIPAAKPEPREHEYPSGAHSTDELARTIAEEFDDVANLAIYRTHCRRCPEAVIRRAHEATLAVPPDKVKRSRLALFIYLVKKYASETD